MVVVAIDIGRVFVRVGLPGDSTPKVHFVTPPDDATIRPVTRAAFPPQYQLNDAAMDEAQRQRVEDCYLANEVHRLVSRMYTWDTACDRTHKLESILACLMESFMLAPSSCRAILVEPLLVSRVEKEAIASLLLGTLQLKSVCWVPEPILETIAAGATDCLVVHMGWLACLVSAVADLRVIDSRECTAFSGSVLHYTVLQRLVALRRDDVDDLLRGPNRFELIEEYIQSEIHLSSLNDSSETSTFSAFVSVPNSIRNSAFELLTESGFIEEVVALIAHSTVDLRPALLQNVVFVGGLANISGLKSYITDRIRIHWQQTHANVSLGSWTGLSIYYSSLANEELAAFHASEYTRDQYRKSKQPQSVHH
jgi:hypothetical protein